VACGESVKPKSLWGSMKTLVPTGLYYSQGAINLNGPSNIIQVEPYVELQITKSVRVIADNDFFWRTSLRDGIYGLATNLLVSGQGNRERYVGTQLSAGAYWQGNRHLLVDAAHDHFFAGPFLGKGAPPQRSLELSGAVGAFKILN